MANSRLHAVYELGQSIWYDNIRRGLITSGDLQKLIDDAAVVGVTSNPTIFEKAIGHSADYDDALRKLVSDGVTEPGQIFEALAVEDIQTAADVLRPTYDRTEHHDGYISLEVSPTLANDTQGTINEAQRLFARASRPNVMIKIPATAEGLPAIEEMIYEGVNINVTLIFALDRYREVTEAFIRGLERRQAEGKPVAGIASVASFFVSRVDTLVDQQLDEKIAQASDDAQRQQIEALKGKAAIANAKLAYKTYEEIFHGDRFAALRDAGAHPQRCLWASTSTKNPAYRDVMYVEELIGPETVDTMPPQTIVAFQEHGVAERTVDRDVAAAETTMNQLADAGIDMAAVTKQLELEGVKSFADSFNQLLQSTAAKSEQLRAEMSQSGQAGEAGKTGQSYAAPGVATDDASLAATATAEAVATHTATDTASTASNASNASNAPDGATPSANTSSQQASLGDQQSAVDATLERADREQFARRVWQKDPALWKPNPNEQSEITDRLGWLTVTEQMADALPRLNDLRNSLKADGFTHVVLLGMGGSSLAPEVLRATFGVAEGCPDLHVLDSTDPGTILDIERVIDLPHTAFIVASKSGVTLETLSQYKYFADKMTGVVGEEHTGAHFIAITDPGTKLDQLAQEHKFRATFRNPSDIGGRYSALSFFGLVPAAIIGMDVEKLISRADTMRRACDASIPASQNPGVWLGAILGTLASHGRDKVTIVVSPSIATFGYWLEQLLAESTGKEGKGILPVEGEALGKPEVYGPDRLFAYLRTEQGADADQDAAITALEQAGQPVVRLTLADTYDLGQEFFRWEFATAVAGALLGINAFDQPNVQESKDNTDRILAEYTKSKLLPRPDAILKTESNNVALVAQGDEASKLRGSISLQAAFETFAREANSGQPGDYFALLAYVERTPTTDAALQRIRLRLRDTRQVATTLGYGPRFQHSTGQLHKGGANTGVFLQFVATDHEDVAIPDAPYTFGTLKGAQALGDLQSLMNHGRRVIRVDLGADIEAGLAEIQEALDAGQQVE
ncbi:MAG: bifunctional transaldolase/phosoglucose isomerase [Ktedonobacterales bacterium]